MTLIRSNGAGRAAMDAAFAGLFGVESATAGVSFDGRTDRAIFLETLTMHDLLNGDPAATVARTFDAYLERLPASLDRLGGEVLPGVTGLLDALAGGNAVIGLATGNVRRGAEAKLRHFGLWEHFAGGGFGDHATVRADLVRAGIDELAAAAGVPAERASVIVLGDTPLDVEAAHVAGAQALGVGTGRFTVEQLLASGAEWAVPDLSDTNQVLRALLG